ncbi:MAG: hypothetical protein IIY31_01805 [Desulfovibrio sp.]|nr:hypothetical protein [Desulfovibrio sp.]
MSDKENLGEKIRALADEGYSRRKQHFKVLRTLIEIVVVALLLFVVYSLFFTLKTYRPYDSSTITPGEKDTGFISLSYFGVDHIGDTSTLIGQKQLRKHLKELHDQGYVTVTQQDILDYYKTGKPLPSRSLYLMFEDGRRDTAIFAQPVLEELNYKASIMSYAENVESMDMKFLKPSELSELVDSSF